MKASNLKIVSLSPAHYCSYCAHNSVKRFDCRVHGYIYLLYTFLNDIHTPFIKYINKHNVARSELIRASLSFPT